MSAFEITQEVIDSIIEHEVKIHCSGELRFTQNENVQLTNNMTMLVSETLTAITKDTEFEPICGFIGDKITCLWYARVILFARINERIFKISFRIHYPKGASNLANYICEMTEHRYNPHFPISANMLYDVDTDCLPYGYGALFTPPVRDTEEQKSLYQLQKNFKLWSKEQNLCKKLRKYESHTQNKQYVEHFKLK